MQRNALQYKLMQSKSKQCKVLWPMQQLHRWNRLPPLPWWPGSVGSFFFIFCWRLHQQQLTMQTRQHMTMQTRGIRVDGSRISNGGRSTSAPFRPTLDTKRQHTRTDNLLKRTRRLTVSLGRFSRTVRYDRLTVWGVYARGTIDWQCWWKV